MRPIFNDLFNQEVIIREFENYLENSKTKNEAWLIIDESNFDSNFIAKKFARALLCEELGCGNCEICESNNELNHPDFDELEGYGNSIRVEEVRELVSKAYLAPSISTRRIVLVNNSEKLNETSSNALLKSLEESNKNTTWILSTNSRSEISMTLRSRCRQVEVKPLTPVNIAQFLKLKYNIDSQKTQLISRICFGSLKYASQYVEISNLLSTRTTLMNKFLELDNLSAVFEYVKILIDTSKELSLVTNSENYLEEAKVSWGLKGTKMAAGGNKYIKEIEKQAKDKQLENQKIILSTFLISLATLVRDIIMLKTKTFENESITEIDLIQKAMNKFQSNSEIELIKILDLILDISTNLNKNLSENLMLESLFSQIRHLSSVGRASLS
ncbi:MAG: hypothetical protein RLZZ378_840 [Actinomycetota bacterium]